MLTPDQLRLCEVCDQRKFNMQQGLLCGLTDQKADFLGTTCPDFEKDQIAFDNREKKEKLSPDYTIGDPDSYGPNQGSIMILHGFLVMGLGIVLFIVTWSFGYISAYPVAFVIGGLILLFKGVGAKEKNKNSKRLLEDSIDQHDF